MSPNHVQNEKAEIDYYDRKAERMCYDTGENYEEIYTLFGLDSIHQNGESILDAGCGTDAFGIRLAKHGYFAIGVDISKKQCKFVRSRSKREKVNFPTIVGDLMNLPFRNEAFDNIFCGAVLHHFMDFTHPLTEMLRVLKRDGRIIIVEPNGSNPLISFYFRLNRFLKKWLKKEGYLTINETPHNIGTYHRKLKKHGAYKVQNYILKRNSSIKPIQRTLLTIALKFLPLSCAGTEIVITAMNSANPASSTR